MAWDWLRGRKARTGDAFGRPTRRAARDAQRFEDRGRCPDGYYHRGPCRHR